MNILVAAFMVVAAISLSICLAELAWLIFPKRPPR